MIKIFKLNKKRKQVNFKMPFNINRYDLDEFTQGYIQGIFHAEHHNLKQCIGIHPEALVIIIKDCNRFQLMNNLDLTDKFKAGYHFWFSRNRKSNDYFKSDFHPRIIVTLNQNAAKFKYLYVYKDINQLMQIY